jgi:hypothetical protein
MDKNSLLSNPPLLSSLRNFVVDTARAYERDRPRNPAAGARNVTGRLRSGIDALLAGNQGAISAEDAIRRLNNERFVIFVHYVVPEIESFVRQEHPELISAPFSFNGESIMGSRIFIRGMEDVSCPIFKEFIIHVVGLYEHDHPRDSVVETG